MANPSYPRAHRLAETIKRTLGEWLEHQPSHRQLGFVTITDVRVTGDLRHAKVYVTVLDPELAGDDGGDDSAAGATMKVLEDATPEARTWVAQNVRLRYAPTLEFLDDDVARQGARIDQLEGQVRARSFRAEKIEAEHKAQLAQNKAHEARVEQLQSDLAGSADERLVREGVLTIRRELKRLSQLRQNSNSLVEG